VCPAGFHFDVIHPGCKPNDDSSCDKGYKWDEEWGRCIPARSAAAAFPFNQLTQNRPTGSTSGSSGGNSNSNNNNNNNYNPGNSRSNPSDPTSGVSNGSADDAWSSFFSTALIFSLPAVVAFALIMNYCYFRRRDEDLSDLDAAGALRSTHVHNLAKFCAYPPYGRSGLIKGPACTGPVFPGVPCCAVAGKLHVGPKLSVLESVAEEGRMDTGSEAESITDPVPDADRTMNDKTIAGCGTEVAVTADSARLQGEGDSSSSPLPPPPSCSELNELSSTTNGKQLDSKSAADTVVTITENPCVSQLSELLPPDSHPDHDHDDEKAAVPVTGTAASHAPENVVEEEAMRAHSPRGQQE
jgi:hypothetical protein